MTPTHGNWKKGKKSVGGGKMTAAEANKDEGKAGEVQSTNNKSMVSYFTYPPF